MNFKNILNKKARCRKIHAKLYIYVKFKTCYIIHSLKLYIYVNDIKYSSE